MNATPKTVSAIATFLHSRFDLTADVQVIPVKGERRTLYQLEHIPLSRRMTLAGLERLCRRIAKALDAELYGTVNVDFGSLGDSPSFDLLVEVYATNELQIEATCSKMEQVHFWKWHGSTKSMIRKRRSIFE